VCWISGELKLVVIVVRHQLLATGLSGLYSSLPRRLDYPSDDWNHFTAEDVAVCPALGMFLNSLEFCNAVVQVNNTYVSVIANSRRACRFKLFQIPSSFWNEGGTKSSVIDVEIRFFLLCDPCKNSGMVGEMCVYFGAVVERSSGAHLVCSRCTIWLKECQGK